MGLDTFQLYTIPSLPPEFLSARGAGYISVTLAFDPPTRHTRSDSYLGVTMGFALYRNIQPATVADAIRQWSREEQAHLSDGELPSLGSLTRQGDSPAVVNLQPVPNLRKKSTLQRGRLKVSRSNWRYDGGSLTLAVICQRKWAPAHITSQRFAVVVSLSHDDPAVEIHARMRQHARIFERVRTQVRV